MKLILLLLLLLPSVAFGVQKGQGLGDVVGQGPVLPMWDVVVCPTGCLYSSVGTAFATEGASKSYYIARGTYTEANNVLVPGTSTIFFDGSHLDLAANKSFQYADTSDYSYLSGDVTIHGDDHDGPIVYCGNTADYITAKDLHMLVNNDPSEDVHSNGYDVGLKGNNSSYNIIIRGETRTIAAPMDYWHFVTMWDAADRLDVRIEILGSGCTDVNADCNGLSLYKSDGNSIHAIIYDVVTGGGDDGVSINVNDSDYNVFYGVSIGADADNYYEASSTGNVTTSLVNP